jgi:hypothetical protein
MKKGLESSIKYHKTSLWHRLIYFIKNGKSMYDGSKNILYEMDEQALYYANKINTMEDEVGQTNATQRSTAIKRCRLKRNNFQIINNMKEKHDALEDLGTCNNFIADVSTRFLPFYSISDLLRKVGEIKEAHKIKSETFRQTLKEKGIKFSPIDDYGVSIDIGLLSEEDIRLIKNQDNSFIQKVYDENGVVLNVC